LGILIMALWIAHTALVIADESEAAIKASYLVKFVPFVRWPDGVFTDSTSPVTLCIVGDDPFGSLLDQSAAQSIGPRRIVIRRFSYVDSAELSRLIVCNIAYFGDPALSGDVLGSLQGKPILTVSDGASRSRGVIHFVLQMNHVRFDVDQSLAESDKITISSTLLELARNVFRRGAAP
jgi:hypothetical protein